MGFATGRQTRRWRRSLWHLRGAVLAGVVAALAPAGSAAEDEYAVAPEPGVGVRALLDLRVVRGSEAPSWQEGGPGTLRYGGIETNSGGFERVTRFAISQLAVEPWADLPWGMRAHVQVNWDGDIDDRGDTSPPHDVIRLVEGVVRKEWGDAAQGWGLLAGVSNPPYSLENVGPAWTPALTLTPSALNSWLWEEGRLLGLEGEWWRTTSSELELDVFGGLGWGPDQQGILLAKRGWVLSDFLSGINSELPLPGPGPNTDVFDERDGRPAVYIGGTARDPWKIAKLRAGFYDNLGDLAVQGVWETYYGSVGVDVEPLPGLDIVFQYLIGHTATRTAPLSSTVQALYPLVSYRWRSLRVSFRYDDFQVHDDDGAPSTTQHGHAFTVSALFEFWRRHRIGVEYITVDSERAGVSPPGDDGWQVSYRFRY
jgi:hypothetical protein